MRKMARKTVLKKGEEKGSAMASENGEETGWGNCFGNGE